MQVHKPQLGCYHCFRHFFAERIGLVDFYDRGLPSRTMRQFLTLFSAPNGLKDPLVQSVITYFTTPRTGFFRQKSLEPVLKNEITCAFQRKLSSSSSKPTIRIWNPGCSNGKETYSIAMIIYYSGLMDKCNFQIIGTDIRASAIEFAQKGEQYINEEEGYIAICDQDNIPSKYYDLLIEAGEDKRGNFYYNIHPDIKRMVDFRLANLLSPEDYSDLKDIDIVVLFNTLDHFNPQAGITATRLIVSALAPRGVILVMKVNQEYDFFKQLITNDNILNIKIEDVHYYEEGKKEAHKTGLAKIIVE